METLEGKGLNHSHQQDKRVFERTVCANVQKCKTQEVLLYSETTRTQVLGKRKVQEAEDETDAWDGVRWQRPLFSLQINLDLIP